MANVHYYVSQQNGDDLNDGLTALTAWQSLTRATQNIPTPNDGDSVYVHIGPGVYRERVIPLNDGFSDACKIYYVGDDTCQHNINDAKGRIRITGCTGAELTTVGAVLDWTGKLFVELHNVYVDGSSDAYQCNNIPVCRNVHASGLYGFNNSVNSNLYNCSALSGVYGFTTAGGIVNYFSCKSLAGQYGFYVSGGTANHYSCVSVSGSAGFSGGRQFNCTAIGSSSAFNLSDAYNCLGIGSAVGFTNTTKYAHNCLALACVTSFTNSAYATNARNFLSSAVGETLKKVTLENISDILSPYNFVYGLSFAGQAHNFNYTASSTVGLATEIVQGFTPTYAGVSIGRQVRISSLGASGEITIELQKLVGGVWTTQRSKSINVANLTADYVTFIWDTYHNDGDDNLTTASGTWRYRYTATEAAINSSLYIASGSFPTGCGYCIPTGAKDLEGKKLHGAGYGSVLDIPIVEYDTSIYQTVAPSLVIKSAGEKKLTLPVTKDVQVSVTYQVKHNGAAAGKEPLIRAFHPFLPEVSAAHSAGADTWQALTLTFTPSFDGEVDVFVANRDPSKYAWFSDPVVA